MFCNEKKISPLKRYAYNTVSYFKIKKQKLIHTLNIKSLKQNHNSHKTNGLQLHPIEKIDYKYLIISDDNDAFFYNLKKEDNVYIDTLMYNMKQIIKKHENTVKNKEQERQNALLNNLFPWSRLKQRIQFNSANFEGLYIPKPRCIDIGIASANICNF